MYYVHYFMIISNYLFFDLTISCILWLLSTHEMASYELFLSKLTTSWCKLFLLFEKILKQQTIYGKTFYICRHAFIKDLKMNCIHSKKWLFGMSFPCVSCSQPVFPRQHALECESCFRWQHRLCNTGNALDFAKNLFLQPWKLLRILQNNDAIKYISHYKKYGRIGLWTSHYMDELVYGRIVSKAIQ
jgi:hypothetical protein